MFKKPIDKYEGKTKEEIEEIADEFGEQKFTKAEERAMIFAALKTLLPPIIAVCALFGIVIWLFWMLMS
ncbi:MAG: hypothetical protein GX666_05395 [Tissierellia bacterium]|nr:hypothetical protein [Tissierellia bacterium]